MTKNRYPHTIYEGSRILKVKKGVNIRISWKYDDDPDISWLGKSVRDRDEYTVDRKTGTFLGKLVYTDHIRLPFKDLKPVLIYKKNATLAYPQGSGIYTYWSVDGYLLNTLGVNLAGYFRGDKFKIDLEARHRTVVALEDVYSVPALEEDGDPNDDAWQAALRQLREMFAARKLYIDESDDYPFSIDFDKETQEFYPDDVMAYQVIAQDSGHYMDRDSDRYFQPGENHLPPGRWENWSHVDPQTLDDIITNMGSLEAEDLKYAFEDWQYWERFVSNDIWMMGCIATVFVENVEVGEASCWGIESEHEDDSYQRQWEKDLIDEALEQAKKEIERLKKAVVIIEDMDVDDIVQRLALEETSDSDDDYDDEDEEDEGDYHDDDDEDDVELHNTNIESG